MDQELRDYLTRIENRLDQMDGRFDKVDDRLDQMDGRFDKVDGRLDRMDGRLDRVETEVRQTRVLLEGQHNDLKQLAEGIIGTNETLGTFRLDVKREFDETRAHVSNIYTTIDRRFFVLESWKERTDRDPMEIIRERYGKPKAT